ncbi:lipopolysaccharide biosynthesis protein, partial [Dermacoccus nishinomiyaensis]|uniref:lipopolysaccharide biosynthesis protein n=1 Tax=Dermacoccus nishinomiyaensis TaxID=1274 RepID=UPI0028A2AF4F
MNATSADARPDPGPDAAEATSEAPSGRGGVVLAVAMGLGNLLSYVFVLILTRALGPAGFGAYSALITLGIVLVIPAGALQVVIARRWAHPSLRSSGLGLAVRVGVALSVATMLASPGVDALFHLGGFEPTIAMAFMLLPMTLTGAYQGVLLGSGAIARLAALYVVTAATRVAGALGCAAAGANVTEVFVVMALTAWCAAAFGLWASRDALVGVGAGNDGLAREMWRSNSTLAAFTALTNVDVVLVRHFLAPETSGEYGLASTFARAMCWGTQFLALLIVPRLA